MAVIRIPCPRCGTELQLRDPALLGKRGKCPRCSERFLLEEPEPDVVLEVAPPLAVTSRPSALPEGISPRRPSDSGPLPADWSLGIAPTSAAVAGKPVAYRPRKRKAAGWIAGAIIAVGLFLVVWAVWNYRPGGSGRSTEAQPRQTAARSEDSTSGASAAPEAAEGAPAETSARPITLEYIPEGTRLVIHFQPARLWKAGGLGEGELIACLGPFGKWLEESVRRLTLEEPANIDELLICVIPKERGTAPDVAAVVRLREAPLPSAMIERFSGERVEKAGRAYFLNNDRGQAFMKIDAKSYAVVPAGLADEMVRASDGPLSADPGLEMTLNETDRGRLMTVALVPMDLTLHGATLLAPDVIPLADQLADWLSNGEEIEAAAWSVDLVKAADGAMEFDSRLDLRTRLGPGFRPERVAEDFREKLETTPRRILAAVEMMSPPAGGKRRIIGRVPAMSKVFALQTRLSTGDRRVTLSTRLPERAAPNLALGTLLAWDESTRTDFRRSPGSAEPPTPKIPDRIADRLLLPVEVDFRRDPMEAAFKEIASQAKFEIVLDSKALEGAGYPKHSAQEFALQGTAEMALFKIVNRYPKMCLSIDEKGKKVIVTTLAAAEEQKIPVYKFSAQTR